MTYDPALYENRKVNDPNDLYRIMREILLRSNAIDQDREHFWVVSLAFNKDILNIELIAKGGQTSVPVHPMEVYSLALTKRAHSIIVVHNHPSGNLKPSQGDKEVTNRLYQAGNVVETPLIDHLIITPLSYYSFKESGLLGKIIKSESYQPKYKLKNEAKREGLKKGLEKGKKEGIKEVARQLKIKGLDIETIAEVTGLTITYIKRIKID